jgi:hypothetical protein
MELSYRLALPLTSIDIVFILLFLLILSISCPFFHNAFATSPAFDRVFITDEQIGGKENEGFKLMVMTALI